MISIDFIFSNQCYRAFLMWLCYAKFLIHLGTTHKKYKKPSQNYHCTNLISFTAHVFSLEHGYSSIEVPYKAITSMTQNPKIIPKFTKHNILIDLGFEFPLNAYAISKASGN
jgi:hypothetical protein